MSRLTRDGTAEPVSRDQILRHARGQGNIHFPSSADHEQDWQPYPVDPYSAIQWRLRFKIAVCHTEENYIKHVTLLNRFKIVFLLNRDIGLIETYLKPNIWVLESPGLGSRALKGQAVAGAPNRSVESAFRNIYAILPCVGGPTRSTILPCCVLVEYILLRIYCRINCSLSQGYSNIIYTL